MLRERVNVLRGLLDETETDPASTGDRIVGVAFPSNGSGSRGEPNEVASGSGETERADATMMLHLEKTQEA